MKTINKNSKELQDWIDSVNEYADISSKAIETLNEGQQELLRCLKLHQDLLKSLYKTQKGQTALLTEYEMRIKELERIVKDNGVFNPMFIGQNQ